MYNITVGVTGSIAAYKSADIINSLKKQGCNVTAIMTNAARHFITPLTLQTLSGNKVYTDIFQEDNPSEVMHIALAQKSDLVLIAPATGNIMAKIAHGIADDMLSSTCLAVDYSKTPLVIAPAMNTTMYESSATQTNIDILKSRGAIIVEPKTSLLACGDYGKGALADVEIVVSDTMKVLRGNA